MECRTLKFSCCCNPLPKCVFVSFHKGLQYVRSSEDLPLGFIRFVLFEGVFRFLSNINRIIVSLSLELAVQIYEGWNFNSGNYLFTTDTK